MNFLQSDLYTYFLLPFLIVVARVIDVSLGTIKFILLARGNRSIAPILGFAEMLVWLLAVTRIFQNLDNWVCYVAYAIGFSLGSLVGLKIEEKIAFGVQLIRIITRKEANKLVDALREKGYGITLTQAEGSNGPVGILYSVMSRKDMKEFVNLIREYNPNAFYTIEDIRFVSQSSYMQKSRGRSKGK